MKTSKILTITALALALGLSTQSFASEKNSAGFNVAVIDVQKVVENSPQVSALKTEQKNKLTDLMKFVDNAKADVAKQSDEKKKKTLEEAYNKELNTKKAQIDKEYTKKLSDIDKKITEIINSKSVKYDLVLTKATVIKGGVDITNEIIKELK